MFIHRLWLLKFNFRSSFLPLISSSVLNLKSPLFYPFSLKFSFYFLTKNILQLPFLSIFCWIKHLDVYMPGSLVFSCWWFKHFTQWHYTSQQLHCLCSLAIFLQTVTSPLCLSFTSSSIFRSSYYLLLSNIIVFISSS
jgi:hypothetical protein